jgi:cysteine desulfurase
MKSPVYLDYSATTPCDPRVVQRMLPFFSDTFGNAASRSHAFGWTAEAAVEEARSQVALLIGAHQKEILWTSGSTEANNLAIKGVAQMYRPKGNHLITAITEHKAVLDPMKFLETQGFEVTWLPVDGKGHVDLDQLAAAITDRTILVSLMAANNEIGTLHPIEKIGAICKQKGTLFHTDATQATGKIPIDVEAQHIDLLSMSAHKMYGPKGVGCLYVRRKNPRVRLTAQMDGGGHERGMRSGTLNVTGIVGMGEAARICREEMATEIVKLRTLRDRLEQRILKALPDAVRNGDPEARLPHLANLSFPYVEGESLIMGVKELAVSSGIGVHLGEPRAQLRAEGPRPRRRARAQLDPFLARALHDGGRSRLRRRPHRAGSETAARDVPALGNGQEGIDITKVKWTVH